MFEGNQVIFEGNHSNAQDIVAVKKEKIKDELFESIKQVAMRITWEGRRLDETKAQRLHGGSFTIALKHT
jgi:hypothetical protein